MEVLRDEIHRAYIKGKRIACCPTMADQAIGIAKQIAAKRMRLPVSSLATRHLFNGNIEVFSKL